MHKITICLLAFLLPFAGFSQEISQTVRGTLVDRESHTPLMGAHVYVEKTVPMLGAVSDEEGRFEIRGVPVGRHTVVASYLGYDPVVIPELMIISGKELVLTIELTESVIAIEEAVVKADADKSRPLNEMALVSARMFSVEETSRYAGSMYDPARMALNYAGVSIAGGSSDLFNEIIVRGNSPRGVGWRLEGIEIPNPNHFGSLGNTGGGISMLSSSMLSNSDFYTGAFPAEFGNAISGAFDLKLRKGNDERREYAVMAGLLGVEAAVEGPIGKPHGATYLANLRYSTLGILDAVGITPAGDVAPKYGDMSFNVHVPTAGYGQFNLFGLAGRNRSAFTPDPDSTRWNTEFENYGFDERQTAGTVGLAHKLLLSDDSYVRTVAAASVERYDGEGYELDEADNYTQIHDYASQFRTYTYRLNSTYTRKVNSRQTVKFGGAVSYQRYRLYLDVFDDESQQTDVYLQNQGEAHQVQVFTQWKHRLSETVTATGGLHLNYFGLNRQWSLEPRFALRKTIRTNQFLTLAAGLHSKPEHPAFYLLEITGNSDVRESPNKDLAFTKAAHFVLGYEYQFNRHFRIRAETYFQYLYDIPVEDDIFSTRSMLNVIDIYDMLDTGNGVDKGRGKNIGIDITLEKNFNNNYYFQLTTSLFDSKYRALNKRWYNTRFNSNYQVNLVGGREWKTGPSGNRIFSINGKALVNGGNRLTPVDVEQSRIEGRAKYLEDQPFTQWAGTYYRLDMMVSYSINRPRVTHTLKFDVQNVTNRLNIHSTYYNEDTGELDHYYQTGILPVLNYRLEF